mgnify:FL=1
MEGTSSVAKNLDMELKAVEDVDVPAKLIRVVCKVKKEKKKKSMESCIKQLTPQAVHIWNANNNNLNSVTKDRKKRKHNASQEVALASTKYTFDRVYSANTTQQQFYDGEVKSCVAALLDGFDSTMFAYGNTNSGKSYTIFGQPKSTNRKTTDGVLFRIVQDIFKRLPADTEVKISAFEIYNEKVFDLLDRVRHTGDLVTNEKADLFPDTCTCVLFLATGRL